MTTLTVSPLNTSHGAEYTCQAEISIPSISVTSSGSESRAVMVQSKSLYFRPALSDVTYVFPQSPGQW